MESMYPKCGKCGTGTMLPLSTVEFKQSSSFEHVGMAEKRYSSWICSRPQCHFKIDSDSKPEKRK